MAWRARAVTLGMVFLVVLGMPSVHAAQAQEGGGVDLVVTILPAPVEGTFMAALTEAALAPTPQGAQANSAVLSLVVTDERGSAGGWQVKISHVQSATGDRLWLDHYRRRADRLSGQPIEEAGGPRGRRLAVGQPLDLPTPVFAAAPGAGAGMYWVQFTVSTETGAPIAQQRLIVTASSAP